MRILFLMRSFCRSFILLSLLGILFGALYSCSRNPVTGKNEFSLLSESQEILLGEESYFSMQQAQGGAYVVHKEIGAYVASVGRRLAEKSDRPDLPYEFVVLNNAVPNAWALPGGKIAIHRGLLTELTSEAELAAVLSHEIAHSAARHGAKGIERQLLFQSGLLSIGQAFKGYRCEELIHGSAALAATLLTLKYSRGAESEADFYGISYMASAGYDPQAAVDLQETFLRLSQSNSSPWLSGLFATHPPSLERKKANETSLLCLPQGGKVGKEEYAAAMDKLIRAQSAYNALEEGYEALSQKDAKRALSLAKKGIEKEPKEAHLHHLKGRAEKKLGLYKEALVSFNEAIALNPEYFDFYLKRGVLEFELDNFSISKRDLQKSVELFPTAEAHQILEEILLREERDGRD